MSKQFNPQTYQPIDYRTYVLGNQARQGINLKRLNLLTPNELKLWKASEEFHDARDDPGHAEFSTIMALRILPYYPDAIREIAIPTITLHDDGWYGGDPYAWRKAVEEARAKNNLKSLDSPEKRKAHQDKGAEMALNLFQRLNYPREEYRQESADIIRDHDTRLKPTTPSGKVVWDSDYLWRVSLPCNQIYLFSEGINDPTEILKRAEDCYLNVTHPRRLDDVAQQIARIEITNTLFYKSPKQAEKILSSNGYLEELETVKKFYSN